MTTDLHKAVVILTNITGSKKEYYVILWNLFVTLLCFSTIIHDKFVDYHKKQSTVFNKIVVNYYNMVEIAIAAAV